jgi:hypothetical protein
MGDLDGSTCHSEMALHHGAYSLALVLTVETDFGYILIHILYNTTIFYIKYLLLRVFHN